MNPVKILLLLSALAAPFSVSAGTGKDSASLASEMVDVYGEGTDTEPLKLAVLEAIDAGISAEVIEAFIMEGSRAGRSPAEVSAYIEIAADLHSQGIPTEIFFNAMLEGFVKGAREVEMRRSIGMLQSRLLFCREMSLKHTGRRGAKGGEHELLLNALFYTMNMGFSEDEVKKLSSAVEETGLSGRTFFGILRVAMELSNFGIGNGQITVLMERSIRSGVSIQQMSMFPEYVNEERAKGLTDDEFYRFLLRKADEDLASEKSPEDTRREYGPAGSPAGGKGGSAGGPSTGGGPGGGK